MKNVKLIAAATLAALSLAANAAPNCPAGATPGSAECPMGGPGAKRGGHMHERLKAADTNNDGMISREEAKALPRIAEQFDAIDANRDGFITLDELRAYHQAHKGEQRGEMWKTLDANGDGKLSREEVAGHPRLAKEFDAIDANKDGFLSPDELQAARGRHAAKAAPKS
jgi:Ca2+-binding EF-hand superfamily protein